MGRATGDGGDALPLRSIDVVADRLLLLGGSFDAARLRAQPSTIGTDVHVDSPRLAGSLSIPRAESAPVTGRFARVFWNAPPKKGGANEPAPEKETPADDDIDPAGVPPLDLVIDELRFGDAVFGKAEVHTRPVAGGLRIERLQTRAPRSEEHTSELQSIMRISYAGICLKKKKRKTN